MHFRPIQFLFTPPSTVFVGVSLGAFFLLSLALTTQTQAQTHVEKSESKNQSSKPISVLPLEDLRVFTKAYELIRSSYIDEIDDRTLLEYAIRGMLDELDPHSSYLDGRKYEDLKKMTTGEFGGLGIEIGTQDGYIKIISPIDDTPAEKAGIKAGDLISKINGSPVKGNNIADAIDKMRGDVGTNITLTIIREDSKSPIDFVIKRDIIKVKSVRSDIVDQDIGYFRISQFQLKTGDDLENEIHRIEKINSNLHGIVLDLRNNPGGVLNASIKVSDLFLNEGMIVYTEGRIADANTQYYATKGEQYKETPMVVLINGGSASASEIVAGALQDQGRAIILGTRSFGKGSVQKSIEITPERAIKLTTARYFTPSGRSIQAQGIEPDIYVYPAQIVPVEGGERLTEADLSGHLANDSENTTLGNEPNSEEEEKLRRDNQLYEAVNILRGLHFYKTTQAEKNRRVNSNL